MKKTLITFVLSIWTIISFSQVYADAYTLTIGVRDNMYDDYTWGEMKPLEKRIPIKLEGKDITIYTEEIQYYQTLMPEYKAGENGSYWKAVDSNSKRCKVYLFDSTPNTIAIEYDDACIIYGIIYR